MSDDLDDEDRSLEAEEAAVKADRKRRRSAKNAAADIDKAYRSTLATRDGRAMLWDILGQLGMFITPLVPGSQDLTYAKIGRQNAAFELYATLNRIAPHHVLTMQQENSQ